MHDLVIRNALICDGTGRAPVHGDLAVAGDRIVAVGGAVAAGIETIDAQGLALAPGIIDTHTHYDAQITWDPLADPSPAMGVTSVLIGNCGFTIAPCREADRDLTMRNLVKVEGMSLDALRAGVRWDFETFAQYLDMLERGGVALNVGAFCGHSSVRTYVMGADAHRRAASASEIEAMCAIVSQAMAAGAVGFATSTSPSHNGDGGHPMPSRLADEAEMRALVGAMGACGRGVFMLTKGGTTPIEFLESLAADSARPVMIAALLHNPTRPQSVFDDLAAIAQANARGRELYGQVSCCPLSMDFTVRNPYPLEGIAGWRPALTASAKALPGVLADPQFRAAVKHDLQSPQAVRLFNGEWDKLTVVETVKHDNRHMEGRSIAELAAAHGVHPLDCLLDLALAEDLDTRFTAVLLNSDERAVGRLLTDPHSAIALSDAGAHLTFFCDAGFGLRLLGYWVRERGAMSLEQAVWRLSGQPATIFRIPERGRLAPGYHADLLLFDPATVGRTPNRRVFDLPAGAPRLINDAVGVHGVWVNGVRVADHGGIIDDALARPGRVLRRFGA
jgi:N-acyl-D-aspartate/D-glutamate deacylase